MFDYIVCGGGAAGCVLANRLSARHDVRVLLLEAGADVVPGAVPPDIDDAYPMSAFNAQYQWPGLHVALHRKRSQRQHYDQARILGGGTSINATAANRGFPQDYDEWKSAGLLNWGWEDVLPYFRRLEADRQFSGEMHGDCGPVSICRVEQSQWTPFTRAVVEHLDEFGHRPIGDQNGEFADGYFPAALSREGASRVTAATAYLGADVRRRANLEIRTGCHVRRVLLAGRRAVAVEVEQHGRVHVVQGANIVLSAGAIHTPPILMRSGVGPAVQLASMAIDPVIDLPAVGENLQDHPGVMMMTWLAPSARLHWSQRPHLQVSLRYSSGLADCPSSDMYLAIVSRAAWHGIGRRMGMLHCWVNKSYSMGVVRLASPDPHQPPDVDFRLLSDPRDMARLAAGYLMMGQAYQAREVEAVAPLPFCLSLNSVARRLSAPTAFNRIATNLIGGLLDLHSGLRSILVERIMSEQRLGHLLSSHTALVDYLERVSIGVKHASGTCRMGTDARLSVVDGDGRVHGAEGLFIADASVMPSLPRANTALPTMMIAEKIAESLLAAQRS